MSLELKEYLKYADPYSTNWNYLHNMANLQMKALGKMIWTGEFKAIYNGLWVIPWSLFDKRATKVSAKHFIERLNEKIMRL